MDVHPFDTRDIRLGMDVYSVDGQYLGVVLRVNGASVVASHRPAAVAPATGFTGESLGPAPTAELGNSGPLVQRRQTDFQSRPDDAGAQVGSFTVGRWYGLIGRREVPVTAVWNVSMERVIVRGDAEA